MQHARDDVSRQPPALITSACGESNFLLPKPVRSTILVSKTVGIRWMSVKSEENRMKPSLLIFAISCAALMADTALADTEVLARAGAWEAFGGTSANGHPLCGVSTSGSGRYFGIKYFRGDDTLTIQLGDEKWSLKNNIRVRVQLQFDHASPWRGNATGMHFSDGDAGLEFNINRNQLDQFVGEFRDANRMIVSFLDEDVSDWQGSLEGTDAVSNMFARCIRNLE